MRKILSFMVAAMLVVGSSNYVAGDLITSVDFESGAGVGYTTSIPEASDGFGDFFTSTDGSNIGTFYEVTGQQGNSWFAAMDTDAAEIGASPASLFINDIVITDFTNLDVQLLVAEDDDGTNEDWDASDSFQIFASIDGGAQFQVFGVENDDTPFNAAPQIDADFDGIGEGTVITDTFAEFTAGIAGTGDELDLEFRFSVNSGDEDLSIDNIRVNGDLATSIPEPSSIALLGLVGLAGVVRRRK